MIIQDVLQFVTQMTVDDAVQAVILVMSTVSAWLMGSDEKKIRFRAGVVGLLSQPFWIYSTWKAGQWGMLVMAVYYVAAWIRMIKNNWEAPPMDGSERAAIYKAKKEANEKILAEHTKSLIKENRTMSYDEARDSCPTISWKLSLALMLFVMLVLSLGH